MVSQTSVLSDAWLNRDDRSRPSARLMRTVVLSLVLHVVVLLVAVGFQLPQKGERPLTSVEVSLVSLPTPVKQAEMAKPAPAPAVKSVAPSPTPSAAPPIGEKRRDILQDFQLPPDAPKFGELSPAKKMAAKPQQEAKTLIVPPVLDVAQDPVAKIPKRSTVSEDLNRELEEELKKIKQIRPAAKLDIPKEVKPSEDSVKPVPQQELKAPAAKTLDTKLKVSGADGSSPYWARVQSIISKHWAPPPVGAPGQTYTVIIEFRLQSDGVFKSVWVKQSSGDFYVDAAGERAVRGPGVLPVFPAEIADSYIIVEMAFRVGESVG
jgi:colicin import membrane protein